MASIAASKAASRAVSRAPSLSLRVQDEETGLGNGVPISEAPTVAVPSVEDLNLEARKGVK